MPYHVMPRGRVFVMRVVMCTHEHTSYDFAVFTIWLGCCAVFAPCSVDCTPTYPRVNTTLLQFTLLCGDSCQYLCHTPSGQPPGKQRRGTAIEPLNSPAITAAARPLSALQTRRKPHPHTHTIDATDNTAHNGWLSTTAYPNRPNSDCCRT